MKIIYWILGTAFYLLVIVGSISLLIMMVRYYWQLGKNWDNMLPGKRNKESSADSFTITINNVTFTDETGSDRQQGKAEK